MARGVSFAEPTKPESTPPCESVGSNADSNVAPPAPLGRRGSTGLGLQRSLRVGNVSALRRAKSEGNNTRRPRAVEGLGGDGGRLQRRATGDQISSRGSAERTAAREQRSRDAEVHSNLGSYFWSDSLGVCWDGRERGASSRSLFGGYAVNKLTFLSPRSSSRPPLRRSALHFRRRLHSRPSGPNFSLRSCRLRFDAFFLPSTTATATAQSGTLSRRANHCRIPRPARHSNSEYSLARPRIGGRG